ncbi:MAG TPA: type II toxin-antitoxin system prevent-host-death family antitoxin [Solirubrobacteraceae bacterium]|jgi:prevent-host-death family protein|nr:type II toxin-antitoxin system prevent-host-death family antitoxin [Solirubrobacteraceae bacterium]
MAKTYDMREAKVRLSELAERASQGEEIVIARNGRPLARLLALQTRRPRTLGLWRGQVRIHPDFDDPLPRELGAAVRGA